MDRKNRIRYDQNDNEYILYTEQEAKYLDFYIDNGEKVYLVKNANQEFVQATIVPDNFFEDNLPYCFQNGKLIVLIEDLVYEGKSR